MVKDGRGMERGGELEWKEYRKDGTEMGVEVE